ECLKSKGFESSEKVCSESENQSENDCLVVENECDKEENPKVIASGIFKLNVSQYVSPISMLKSSCDNKNVEIKLKGKRRKRKSSKQSVKQVYNDVSCANNDFVHFSDLDTFSSVRIPRHRDVIWKKKGSSNTSNVGLSDVIVSNLNKNVKRYSRKDLLACNNYHLGETSSAYMCNDAMNVSCDSRMNDLLDDNNFFIFDDVNVRISLVSKMPFRKKPCDSMNVRSKSTMNKYLPRTVHKWLLKLQPLAEPVAKWFPRIYLWIIDSGCSKHMTGNRARLMNFVEKFLGTVRFANNDFAVIAGYGDVVIGSMMIKKFIMSKAEDITYLALDNFVTRASKLPFESLHALLETKMDVGKLKVNGDIGVFVGYLKESAAFRIYNKRTRKIHESVNVNFDEISEMASKQFSLEPGLSNLNETGKSSNPSVSKIMKSSTTNVETSNAEIPLHGEEVFHEVSKSFQGESSSSSLNDDVQQSPEEVILPSSNTQLIPVNVIPNGDEASTSHNVFNERLKDAYFDAIHRNSTKTFTRPSHVTLPPNPAGTLPKSYWLTIAHTDHELTHPLHEFKPKSFDKKAQGCYLELTRGLNQRKVLSINGSRSRRRKDLDLGHLV
nr:integrase, catalytic region, zinc finger, CCHC-type, peptidase aspartic, catalytic [Tanacetum cinerariifolium]